MTLTSFLAHSILLYVLISFLFSMEPKYPISTPTIFQEINENTSLGELRNSITQEPHVYYRQGGFKTIEEFSEEVYYTYKLDIEYPEKHPHDIDNISIIFNSKAAAYSLENNYSPTKEKGSLLVIKHYHNYHPTTTLIYSEVLDNRGIFLEPHYESDRFSQEVGTDYINTILPLAYTCLNKVKADILLNKSHLLYLRNLGGNPDLKTINKIQKIIKNLYDMGSDRKDTLRWPRNSSESIQYCEPLTQQY